MIDDILSIENDNQPGEPLLRLAMRNGRRIATPTSLADIQAHAATELARLPEGLRRLESGVTYEVKVADALKKLASEVDARLA